MKHTHIAKDLRQQLSALSTPSKAEASKRYFPHGIICIGANASDIKTVIRRFHEEHNNLSPQECLDLAEYVLKNAHYSEEKMVAYGLIQKHVKRNFDDTLLSRFEYWLEHYADNWALVDDLCMKTIYSFMLTRPHLIESVQHWAYSDVPWCRRASNVVWVKFINRKMGKITYKLDKTLIFKQCALLLKDDDEFVQKSIGWLLKVTAVEHQADVLKFLEDNYTAMPRSTLRYALEKIEPNTRKAYLVKLK